MPSLGTWSFCSGSFRWRRGALGAFFRLSEDFGHLLALLSVFNQLVRSKKVMKTKSLLMVVLVCLFMMQSAYVWGGALSLVGEDVKAPVESAAPVESTTAAAAASGAAAGASVAAGEATDANGVPERDNKMGINIKPTHQDKKIDWIKLIDPGTAEILGIFDMAKGERDFNRTEDDGRGIHCYLAGEGEERRVMVRSPYANRPLVQMIYADGTVEKMKAPAPEAVGGDDEERRYAGDVGLRIYVPKGDFSDYMERIEKPLSNKFGEGQVNLHGFHSAEGGYYAQIDVHTDKGVEEVTKVLPPAVSGATDGRGARLEY